MFTWYVSREMKRTQLCNLWRELTLLNNYCTTDLECLVRKLVQNFLIITIYMYIHIYIHMHSFLKGKGREINVCKFFNLNSGETMFLCYLFCKK